MPENQRRIAGKLIKFHFIQILAIPQLIGAIICLVVAYLLQKHGFYPEDKKVLFFQMACTATGVLNVLLAMESLRLFSVEKRHICNIVIFNVTVTVLLVIAIILTAGEFADVYFGETIMGSEIELWEMDTLELYKLCHTLGLVASLILFISLFPMAFMLYKSLKSQENR